MTLIRADEMDHRMLNEEIRKSEDCLVTGCLGQRFIAAGMKDKEIEIEGIPGNALGAYLAGAGITVRANAQDAVGDTMNEGRIVIHGDVGDAAGYAMRGGRIYVRGNAGYRAGIHMKEYREKKPVIVIGGKAGSFLGEYQAGGLIIVLGIGKTGSLVGDFPCTGMHGGKLFIRGDAKDVYFPHNVLRNTATGEDLAEIRPVIEEYCSCFGLDPERILSETFTVITPDSSNPYKQMYVAN